MDAKKRTALSYGVVDRNPAVRNPSGTGLDLGRPLPRLIVQSTPAVRARYLSFFLDRITNPNTRQAYANAVEQFLEWVDSRGIALETLGQQSLSAYKQVHRGSPSTISQHMTAIRKLLAWLAPQGVAPSFAQDTAESHESHPTPIRSDVEAIIPPSEMDRLFQSIDVDSVIGLRDRALMACLLYGQAFHVGALANMTVADFSTHQGRIQFLDRAGKDHQEKLHPTAKKYLNDYVDAAQLRTAPQDSPLFRSVRGRAHSLSERGMHRTDILRMIKRRARSAGIEHPVSCKSVRRLGLRVYLKSGSPQVPNGASL